MPVRVANDLRAVVDGNTRSQKFRRPGSCGAVAAKEFAEAQPGIGVTLPILMRWTPPCSPFGAVCTEVSIGIIAKEAKSWLEDRAKGWLDFQKAQIS
jgi:hypothetical protein